VGAALTSLAGQQRIALQSSKTLENWAFLEILFECCDATLGVAIM
jgi:hypothetical protein